MVVIRFDQVRLNAKTLCEFYRRGFFRDEGIRTTLNQEPGALVSLNYPANARSGLEHCEINLSAQFAAPLEHTVRGSQTGDSSANDYDAFHLLSNANC